MIDPTASISMPMGMLCLWVQRLLLWTYTSYPGGQVSYSPSPLHYMDCPASFGDVDANCCPVSILLFCAANFGRYRSFAHTRRSGITVAIVSTPPALRHIRQLVMWPHIIVSDRIDIDKPISYLSSVSTPKQTYIIYLFI